MSILGKVLGRRKSVDIGPPEDISLPEDVKQVSTPEQKDEVFSHDIFKNPQEQEGQQMQYTTGQYPSPQQRYGQMAQQQSGQTGPAYPYPQRTNDTELILAKLDAIKAEIDAMHQRIKTLEKKSSTIQKRVW